MKRITTIFTAIAVSVAALFTTSCVQDLDVNNIHSHSGIGSGSLHHLLRAGPGRDSYRSQYPDA